MTKQPVQPYTRTAAVGSELKVFGYTPEHRLNADEEMELVWEEHDLGTHATHEIAKNIAADWRELLVGLYPIE